MAAIRSICSIRCRLLSRRGTSDRRGGTPSIISNARVSDRVAHIAFLQAVTAKLCGLVTAAMTAEERDTVDGRIAIRRRRR